MVGIETLSSHWNTNVRHCIREVIKYFCSFGFVRVFTLFLYKLRVRWLPLMMKNSICCSGTKYLCIVYWISRYTRDSASEHHQEQNYSLASYKTNNYFKNPPRALWIFPINNPHILIQSAIYLRSQLQPNRFCSCGVKEYLNQEEYKLWTPSREVSFEEILSQCTPRPHRKSWLVTQRFGRCVYMSASQSVSFFCCFFKFLSFHTPDWKK